MLVGQRYATSRSWSLAERPAGTQAGSVSSILLSYKEMEAENLAVKRGFPSQSTVPALGCPPAGHAICVTRLPRRAARGRRTGKLEPAAQPSSWLQPESVMTEGDVIRVPAQAFTGR
jgi:hypothetical protein